MWSQKRITTSASGETLQSVLALVTCVTTAACVGTTGRNIPTDGSGTVEPSVKE